MNDKQRNELIKRGRKFDVEVAARKAAEMALSGAIDTITDRDRTIAELRAELEGTSRKVESLLEERDGLQVQMRTLVDALEAVRRKLDSSRERLDIVRIENDELRQLDREAAPLRKRLRAKTEEIQALRTELSQYRAQRFSGV